MYGERLLARVSAQPAYLSIKSVFGISGFGFRAGVLGTNGGRLGAADMNAADTRQPKTPSPTHAHADDGVG